MKQAQQEYRYHNQKNIKEQENELNNWKHRKHPLDMTQDSIRSLPASTVQKIQKLG